MANRSRDLRPLGDLKVVVQPLSALKLNRRNARTHSPRQIRQIADSIRAFGFNNPVLVDKNNLIVAGHGRAKAAKLLGMTEVPTVPLSRMTEAQMRAYVIADNRLAEKAGWDEEILAIELQTLTEIAPEFDLTITGFEISEIDFIIQEHDDEVEPDALDDVAPPDAGAPVVTRGGDLWQLDRHRVLCADATRPEAYARLLQGEPAQMVFTDPPYNVPIGGHVSGLGHAQHDEFPMASGEMSEDEFAGFLTTTLSHIRANSVDSAIAFVCIDWRHYYELVVAGRAAKLTLKNLCVWVKTNAGMGSFYRSRHELIAVFKVGTAPHINSFELGQHGRYRTNVWTYPGANGFGTRRDEALAMHPTVKPVALVADAIKDCSKRNGLILDPFFGSGTTVIAAELTGRRASGFELDPRYVDTIIRRWQQMTSKDAVLAATGETFETVANARAPGLEEVSHG
jgi:DNA modification methylase